MEKLASCCACTIDEMMIVQMMIVVFMISVCYVCDSFDKFVFSDSHRISPLDQLVFYRASSGAEKRFTS
jgi:hypothetical protein